LPSVAGETLIKELCEVAPVGIALVDQSLRFVWVNDALCSMLGYSRDEFLTMQVTDISHPDSRNEDVRQRFVDGELCQVTLEKRHVTKTGETKWVRVNACIFRPGQDETEYGALFVEDISDRVAEEREMADQVRRAGEMLASLTPREKQLLLLAAEGKTFAEIASILFISKRTVESHAASAYRKLGAAGREDAVRTLLDLERVVSVRTTLLSTATGFTRLQR
jgi:PAS domain S-box-containing protein